MPVSRLMLGAMVLALTGACSSTAEEPPATSRPAAEPPPAGARTAPAGEQATPVVARGRAYTRQFYAEELAALRESFSPGFAAEMSLDELRQLRSSLAEQLGTETAVVAEDTIPRGEFTIYSRRARFAKSPDEIEVLFALRDDLTIAGLLVRPAAETPAH